MFGVSSDAEAMDAFGIKKENQFIVLESLEEDILYGPL